MRPGKQASSHVVEMWGSRRSKNAECRWPESGVHVDPEGVLLGEPRGTMLSSSWVILLGLGWQHEALVLSGSLG